jgi:hypothetical protein
VTTSFSSKVHYHQSDRDDTTCPRNQQLGISLPLSQMHNFGSHDLMTCVLLISMTTYSLLVWPSGILGYSAYVFPPKDFSSEPCGSSPDILSTFDDPYLVIKLIGKCGHKQISLTSIGNYNKTRHNTYFTLNFIAI